MEGTHETNCEFFTPTCNPTGFYTYLLISLSLIASAGCVAGLTQGLLALDMLNMRILEMSGSETQQRQAKSVLPVITRHHFLLVTLLLVNAGANEALPIFLSRLVPEWLSVVLSVTCVLMFGEIIPTAVFTGPSQLAIASALAPFVKALMFVLSPIAYPISLVLDAWLGAEHDPAKYKRKELKALVALQKENEQVKRNMVENDRRHRQSKSQTPSSAAKSMKDLVHDPRHSSAIGTDLHVDEVTIIQGALDLSSKTVNDVMVPIKDVYMLDSSLIITEDLMADILASGHSRIPVYEGNRANIRGLLLVKRLIVVDPEDERTVGEVSLRKPIVVEPTGSCYAILNEFQKGRSHMALVTPQAKLVQECWDDNNREIPSEQVQLTGIITIEDVLEELIQEEIEDETDTYMRDMIDKWEAAAGKSSSPPIVETQLRKAAQRARLRIKNQKKAKEDDLGRLEEGQQPREDSPLLPKSN